MKDRDLATLVAGWYGPIQIVAWLVAVELIIACLEFVLGFLLPWNAHPIVSSVREALVCIVWIVGWWQLRKVRRSGVAGFESWRTKNFAWFVAVRTLVAIYRVVFVAEGAIGFEIVPRLWPILGGSDWALWGLHGLGIGLAIMVLLQVNRVLDGALVTMGGIGCVAIVGALAMVGGALQRICEVLNAASAESTRIDLAGLSVRVGFWGAWIVFRVGLLILLLGAGRRLNRYVRNQCFR